MPEAVFKLHLLQSVIEQAGCYPELRGCDAVERGRQFLVDMIDKYGQGMVCLAQVQEKMSSDDGVYEEISESA